MEKKNLKFRLCDPTDAPKNVYSFDIACDCDGSDYCDVSDEYSEDEVDELMVLMVAYFNMDEDSIPAKWKRFLPEETISDAFGGRGIQRNCRFDTLDESNWLAKYADEHGLLLYNDHGALCQNIIGICVDYYDETGRIFECCYPDLGAHFYSEAEFIVYVHWLANSK